MIMVKSAGKSFFQTLFLMSSALVIGFFSTGMADAAGATVETVSGRDQTAVSASGVDDNAGPVPNSAGDREENDDLQGERESTDQSALDVALDLTDASREYLAAGEVEKAIEALDQAYALTLEVNAADDPKLIRQKDEIRFTISRNILELYSSRYIAENGGEKTIPFTVNKHVELEIERFKGEDRRFFMEAYKRSGVYREEIVQALRDAGLPVELSWLPFIENGFRPKTLSRGRALGLWQFIPSTGYKFGLIRNDWLDERMDPAKSTYAAIAYLKELYRIFGDWAAVIAAYHSGERAVMKVIREQKINYFDKFWELYEQLPDRTARYYPRFLALLAIVKDPSRYGMVLDGADVPLRYDIVTVERQVHLKSVAEKIQVAFDELAALNPELRRDVTPGSAYPLKVPLGKGPLLLASLETIPGWTAPPTTYLVHRVRKGETLSVLARKYRTSIRTIARLNNIRPSQYLRVGQMLKIRIR